MLRRDRWRIVLVVLVLLASAASLLPWEGKIRLGLDLKGGSHIVVRAVPEPGEGLDRDAMERLLLVLRNRIDQYGVAEPVIQREGADRVIVQLPGVSDPEAALELIGKTALLEFRKVLDVLPEPPTAPRRENYASDEEFERARSRYEEAMRAYQGSRRRMEEEARARGEEVLVAPDAEREGVYYLLGRAYVTGANLRNAGVAYDSLGKPMVTLEFNDEGAKLFDQATAENVGRPLAITLDGVVFSAPVVRERISGGRAQITGNFTLEEASRLAIMLRAGALPLKVEIAENRSVGPTLGADSIRRGVRTGLWSFAAVALFMLLWYRGLGLVADLSLLVNMLVLFAALASFKATLTLPGIAGIVLTIGMAVDANILIYERIRDELREGKTAYAAVEAGFSKAFSAIFDSNVTTLIAAFALFYFGSGPIRGFAVTLSVGVLSSMFSALLFTRVLLGMALSRFRGYASFLVS